MDWVTLHREIVTARAGVRFFPKKTCVVCCTATVLFDKITRQGDHNKNRVCDETSTDSRKQYDFLLNRIYTESRKEIPATTGELGVYVVKS